MRNERGFTFVELLVVLAVIGMLTAGLCLTLQQGAAAYQFLAGRAEVQQNARVAADRMMRELRTATQVSASTATSVTFQFLDPASTLVTVQYALVGTSLLRTQTIPVPGTPQPETLIGGVSALAFTNFDRNDVATLVPANVYSVQLRLTTQPESTNPATYSPANQRAVVEDRVRLRNR